MRPILSLTIVYLAALGSAQAQAVMMPANADMRAMQAPINWEGSRTQRTQDADAPPVSVAPPLATQAVSPPVAGEAQRVEYVIDVLDKDGRVTETLARCSDLSVARAAFKQAVRERPRSKVTLSQGTTVVAKRDVATR